MATLGSRRIVLTDFGRRAVIWSYLGVEWGKDIPLPRCPTGKHEWNETWSNRVRLNRDGTMFCRACKVTGKPVEQPSHG